MENQSIYTRNLSTPIGEMYAMASDDGILLLEFQDRKDLQRQINGLLISESNISESSCQHLDTLEDQLSQYFTGVRKEFGLPLIFSGTEFQKKVWQFLLEIPFGKSISYQELTNKLGSPKAIRAVAAANGANRLAIVVPCHRIIGSNGKLTGYAGGLKRKKWLLDHESNQLKLDF